jgi:recombinational DNA repair protein RecT
MTEAPTVAAEVARVNHARDIIAGSLADIAANLPPAIDADRFGAWSLRMLTRGLNDPRQAEHWLRVLNPQNEAGRLSVVSALCDCAALGLEPGREYHLVPFGGTVTGITDYRGEIRLIGNYRPCSVIAMLVRKTDEVRLTGANIPPAHEADWFADPAERGPVIGGYSYVDYGDGEYSLVTRMSAAEFEDHKRASKTSSGESSPWNRWETAMQTKTLIHQTRKLVPWSPVRLWGSDGG